MITKSTKRKTERQMSQASLSMLIDYYISDMQRRNLRPDTTQGARRVLLRFARWLPGGPETRLLHVTAERAAEYVTHLQTRTTRYESHHFKNAEEGPLSPFTVLRQVKELKVFGRWLAREGFLDPFDELKLPKTPKRTVECLSDEEIATIASTMNPQTEIGARMFAMILLMLDSGLRVSEVAGAQMSDLDMQRRQLKVMGKGQKERLVPFGTLCAQALMRYINLYRRAPKRPEFDNLFMSLDGYPMTRSGIESIVRRLRKASGVNRLHAHLLRHTFAVRFLTNGGDLVTLQTIMGHESLEVTRIYLNFTKQQAAARYEGFSPVDRMPLEGIRRFGYKKRKAAISPGVYAGDSSRRRA